MLRAQVCASVAQQKKKEEDKTKGEAASSSALKAVDKVPKRKNDGKDDRPSKKPAVNVGDRSLKKPTLSKTGHEVGKGLLTTSGLVTQGLDRHLLTHKEYAIEMMGSIIRDKDVDPCTELGTDELEASGLFNLARLCFYIFLIHSFVW